MNNLFFDEFTQVGVDYSNLKKVSEYEKDMSFRDFENEAQTIFKLLNLQSEHVLLEYGCGTGNFTIRASERCKQVYAIDVSKQMIHFAKQRAEEENRKNIQFIHSGLLHYNHTGERVDAVVCDTVMHHIPDFWKQIALSNIYNVLKKDGHFYLADQIYSFSFENYQEKLNEWIDFNYNRSKSDCFRNDVKMSIQHEFSTFNWIIEKMLKNVGFTFEKVSCSDCFSCYICIK